MIRAGLIGWAMLAGTAFVTQIAINAQLARFVGSPLRAAVVSFAGAAIVAAVLSTLLPAQSATIRQSAWWMWCGGAFGVVVIGSSIALAPRLGAGLLAVSFISGQLIAAVVFDHFGVLGYRVQPISWWRVLGVIAIIVGVALVQRR